MLVSDVSGRVYIITVVYGWVSCNTKSAKIHLTESECDMVSSHSNPTYSNQKFLENITDIAKPTILQYRYPKKNDLSEKNVILTWPI